MRCMPIHIAVVSALICGVVNATPVLSFLEISGPDAVAEFTATNYTCIGHYSDSSSIDLTAMAQWLITGTADVAQWRTDLMSAKADSDLYDIPLVYIWGHSACAFCDDLESYIARPNFEAWMQRRRLVMCYVEADVLDDSPEKLFAKKGLNGTLYDYPYAAVYWPSKNTQPWNFTARYADGGEELQFIAEIESYIGEYISSGVANCAGVDSGELTAGAVEQDTTVTIQVSFDGKSAQKAVTVLDVPEPVLLKAESFESGFGFWFDSIDNDFNWSRNSGVTPSLQTGPYSASDGNYYIYAEATDRYPAQTSAIETVFNIESLNVPAMAFDYQMYGSSMGALYVDVYDGSWHQALWSRVGEQHTAANVPWSEGVVDLSAFSGNIIVRLRAVIGSGFTSDIAVDNIRFFNEGIIPPLTFSSWLASQSVPLNQREPEDAPADDGVANLLKYACGLSAMQPVTTSDLLVIVPSAAPGLFSVSYKKDVDAVDVILEPIWAPTLTNAWSATGITAEFIGQNNGLEEWRATIPLADAGFIALRATLTD
jgi:hypothetical protein